MSVFIGLIFGGLFGCLLTTIFIKHTEPIYAGTLCLYESDVDKQIELYLELNESPASLLGCECVNFKVKKVDI